MKNLPRFALGILLCGVFPFPAAAAFNSLYVFGDGLSATADTNNAPGGEDFYGWRWSNGRVWVEVLAQRQGLAFDNAKNNSYWEHSSSNLVTQIKGFSAPADVTNDLFVVWVCNADTFDTASALVNNASYAYTNANLLAQSNHLQIITNLYARGVRWLMLPNAVDISQIPAFNAGAATNLLHAECVDYNTRFSNTLVQARAQCPDLTIYAPDFFALMNNVLSNAAGYGLTNALSSKGHSIDAYDDPNIATLDITNGAGTGYIFWDDHDPTAKFHAVIADVVQQIISPARVSAITPVNGSNRLDVVNYPAGLGGFVDAKTNLAATNWTAAASIAGTNTAQSVFVPAAGARQFYRLRFPYTWVFP